MTKRNRKLACITDVRDNRFIPNEVDPASAKLLKELVHELLHDEQRIPVCENVPRP